jgi:hypothetical protein
MSAPNEPSLIKEVNIYSSIYLDWLQMWIRRLIGQIYQDESGSIGQKNKLDLLRCYFINYDFDCLV